MAWVLVYQETTPEWETYQGDGESGVVEWEGNFAIADMVSAQKEEIANNGATLLSLRIWNTGDLWKTESVVHGSTGIGLFPIPWLTIIYGIIALVGTLAVIALVQWGVVPILEGIQDIIFGPEPTFDPVTGLPIYRKGIFDQLKWPLVIGLVVVGVIFVSRSYVALQQPSGVARTT